MRARQGHLRTYERGQSLGQGREPRRAQASDGELGAAVARAQEGDEAAFAVAYRIVQPGLLGYLRGSRPRPP